MGPNRLSVPPVPLSPSGNSRTRPRSPPLSGPTPRTFVNSPTSLREPSDRFPISAAVWVDLSDRSSIPPAVFANPPTVPPSPPLSGPTPRTVRKSPQELPRTLGPFTQFPPELPRTLGGFPERPSRAEPTPWAVPRAAGEPLGTPRTVPLRSLAISHPRSDRSPKPPRTFRNPPTPPLALPRSFRTLSTVRPSRHGFRGPLPPLLPRAHGAVRSLREGCRPAHRTRGGASMSPAPPPERRRLRDPRAIPASRMRHRAQRAPGPMLGPADAALSSQAHDRAARARSEGWRGVGAGSTPAARGSGQTGIGRAERPILESLWSTESIWRTEKARRATWSSLGSGRRGDAEDSPMRHGPRMGRVRPASSADSNESVL